MNINEEIVNFYAENLQYLCMKAGRIKVLDMQCASDFICIVIPLRHKRSGNILREPSLQKSNKQSQTSF